MESANSSFTTLSASNFKVQRVRPSGGRSACNCYQVGFLPPIKFALLARPHPLIEGSLQTFLREALAHTDDSRGANQQGIGNLLVGKTFIGFTQDQGPFHLTGRRFATPGYIQQLLAFILGQVHSVSLSRHSPHSRTLIKNTSIIHFIKLVKNNWMDY